MNKFVAIAKKKKEERRAKLAESNENTPGAVAGITASVDWEEKQTGEITSADRILARE